MKNKVKVECAECGKVEYVCNSRAKRYVCCSVSCLSKYNSKRYNQQIEMICPICGDKYYVAKSKINHHRTCGKQECRHKWLSMSRTGRKNCRYKNFEDILSNHIVTEEKHGISRNIYLHIVKNVLNLNSIKNIPKGYVVHHKDCNHLNNNPENLVLLTKSVHRKLHTIFGNILLNALHTNRIDRNTFYKICNEEQRIFYDEIIDLNIMHQAVVKQGELLESPEEDNQQPSIYRNIYEGSTTNERVLTSDVEDSNFDTSALL